MLHKTEPALPALHGQLVLPTRFGVHMTSPVVLKPVNDVDTSGRQLRHQRGTPRAAHLGKLAALWGVDLSGYIVPRACELALDHFGFVIQ